MARFGTNLYAPLLAGALLAGCAPGPAGPDSDIGPAPDKASAVKKKKDPDAPKGLLKPTEARPGMLYIRRGSEDYTLELLLDTSSVNTVYDVELPERSSEK